MNRRRRKSFFATAGEKRKFFNNMRHFGHTRDIGLAGMALMPALLPLALLAMLAFGLAVFFGMGTHETHQVARHGHQVLPMLGMAAFATPREMREERGKIANQMSALAEKRASWTAEDKTNFKKMDDDQEALRVQIVDIERAEAIQNELRTAPPAANPGGGTDDAAATAAKEERNKKHAKAFRSYLISGNEGLAPEERSILREKRDMGTGGGNALQGTGGGYFVPVGFSGEVESAMKFYGGMLQAADITPTDTGAPLPWPTDNDTSNTGELVGENLQVTTQDVTLSNIIFGAYKFSTKMIKVSIELLQDSAFDIESYLKEKMATRLGRIVNTKTTVGVGTTEPFGIIPQATLGATATGSSLNDGGAGTGANSIGTDDLVKLQHSVDIAYRLQKGSGWMLHDNVVSNLKQLKDKFGRPIWLPALTANTPDTILNHPFIVNNDMASAVTTGQKTVLFGMLKKYKLRQVKGLSVLRLTERFADFGQVAFIGFARYDGNLLDAGTHPVKYLQQA
jgi:HK97 family phage major capsid protein